MLSKLTSFRSYNLAALLKTQVTSTSLHSVSAANYFVVAKAKPAQKLNVQRFFSTAEEPEGDKQFFSIGKERDSSEVLMHLNTLVTKNPESLPDNEFVYFTSQLNRACIID